MCTSLIINYTRKSFAILADESSMNDTNNLPAIGNNKIKSIYHQNCIIPNEDFNILYNSIASKLQPGLLDKNLYPSKDFFNKVSSKLRDLKPKSDTAFKTHVDEKYQKMERPMFVTTVKTGTFLEPPPEVAALLGLRKNSYGSNTGSSTSSTGKAQNAGNGNVIYSFASKPRILKSNLQSNVASRSLFRSENKREKREIFNELPKISNDTSDGTPQYGNTMYDRRVARGSNFASQRPNVISTEHVLSRQAEARRRAAVRQRAQIRARKLRSGTPPPVDGRRHGQIQTDKFLEELTERPSDKSIACQADLAVEHNSPVHFHSSTGVDAETQIYTGDLPDFDEIPSVVTSIVNKILQEAILEINDEIQVIKLQNIASEKRRRANTLTKQDNGIITKNQLNGLLQQAIDEMKKSEFSSTNKNLDQLDSNQLLERIFAEIKNQIFDVKFLTGIIKTQLENWPELIQTNELNDESDKPENQSDREEYNTSNAESNDNAEVTDLRKEPLVAIDAEDYSNEEENEEGEQKNVENDDYKTDDFEEESKDLVEEEDKDSDDEETTLTDENRTAAENENTNPSAQPENTDDNISQQDGTTVNDDEKIESIVIEDDDGKTETAVVEQNENSNIEGTEDQSSSTIDQNTTQVPIITESSNEPQLNVVEQQDNLEENSANSPVNENVDNAANQSEEMSKHEIIDDQNDRSASTNHKDEPSNNSNNEQNQVQSAPEAVNESTQKDVTSLLDPPINDSPEHDIVITSEEFTNNGGENLLTETPEAINKSENDFNGNNVISMLDPPVQEVPNDDKDDITVAEESESPAVNDSKEDDNNSATTAETSKINEAEISAADNKDDLERHSFNKNDENEDNESPNNEISPITDESQNPPKDITDTESVSTNEDDNDVIGVKPSPTEPPIIISVEINDTEGQPTSGVIPDEVQDTLINEMPEDAATTTQIKDTCPRKKTKPINDDDNISNTSSLSTNPSRETLDVKISDTESVENNELQSSDDGTTKDDPNAQTNSRTEETKEQNTAAEKNEEGEKPLNTENRTKVTLNKSDSINENQMDDPQPEPTNKDPTDASNNNTESTNGLEYGPANNPNDQDVSEVRQNAKNNYQNDEQVVESLPEKERVESTSDTNNNDTTKHPTIIVQNGSAVANR